jgi:hypothetical protein
MSGGDESMGKIKARIGAESCVELVDNESTPLPSPGPLEPLDAAYLARGLLACASLLSGPHAPDAGTIIADTPMPVMKWAIGKSTETTDVVLFLSLATGIELAFRMPSQGAKILGRALIAKSDGTLLPEEHRGGLH